MAPVDPDRLRPKIHHIRERLRRLRAVHLYEELDAEEAFRIIEDDLEDFDTFISLVVQRYFESG